MPTGYTAPIAEGITFEQFVFSCARNFGALITMRDDPADATIPERFEPSDYHQKALAKAEAELRRLVNMTDEEAEAEAKADHEAEVARNERYAAEAEELRGKYRSMLEQVCAWEPPTKEHEGLKTFMVEQINESIKFDCNIPSRPQSERKSGAGWRQAKMMKAARDMEYYEQEHQKEVERTNKRNAWVQALRDSLSPAVPA